MLLKLYEVSKAILDRLQEEVVTKSFDYVPEKTLYPYIIVGDIETDDDSTKTGDGVKATQTIQVWSRFPGKQEAMEIGNKVMIALGKELTIANGEIWEQRFLKTKTQEIEEGIYATELKLKLNIEWSE